LRLAVLLHVPTVGGVTRFTQALLDGFLNTDQCPDIGLFLDHELEASGEFSAYRGDSRVSIVPVRDPSVTTSARDTHVAESVVRGPLWRFTRDALRRVPRVHAAAVNAIVTARSISGASKPWYLFQLPSDIVWQLNQYDVVYLAFPYYLKSAKITVPCVGTFHDINQKHFPENFDKRAIKVLDQGISFWLKKCHRAVVSTRFMEEDLSKHYPACNGKTTVVYVAPYSHRPPDEERAQAILSQWGIEPRSYVLYPGGMAGHKNLSGLLRAADIMKRSAATPQPRFVLTGYGSDMLADTVARYPALSNLKDFLASSSLELGRDVCGLGYVSDEEVDALTRMAGLVCSTSLYEAGCGPALDAWQFGVPVAFSAIPPFLEQMVALGTSAWTFDPNDPEDIARAITLAFTDSARSQEMALSSARGIASHTWDEVARAYLGILEQAARSA
jgi:glycosyltransferase involved in cell wall biosynthesis